MKRPAILFYFSASCILTRGFAPVHHVATPPSFAIRMIWPKSVALFYQNTTDPQPPRTEEIVRPIDRFHHEASKTMEIQEPCIISIDGNRYNLSAWGNAHPGGARILQKFHDKDASKAFGAAHHSASAYDMLKDFRIDETVPPVFEVGVANLRTTVVGHTQISLRSRLRQKLFTREDPIGVHKYLGIFCLINFIGRYRQMYFGDPAAGLGSRGHSWFAMACLLPHGLLSMSSLIFHTVPRERVVGKPMIWQEFRIHNIIFGERSVLTGLASALAIKAGNTPGVRKWAVGFSCACVLLSIYCADLATERLRAIKVESTTATMPYWEGCSIATQKRFKNFYAYCQFMATLSCTAVSNPAWPLAVLLAIQLASLLMTLVRKGLLSARGYHYGYTATLVLPYFVGLRSMAHMGTPDVVFMMGLAYAMYQARRRGVSKYELWIPVLAARFLIGDKFINYAVW